MGLIETLRKYTEQRDNPREQQLLKETDAERQQRILRQKMRVYPARSLTNKTRTATAFMVQFEGRMLRDAYKPGDRVPKPESYQVNHYQHRTTHLSHVSSPRFPICVECGDKVRFEPAAVENEQAASISDDRDFFPQP